MIAYSQAVWYSITCTDSSTRTPYIRHPFISSAISHYSLKAEPPTSRTAADNRQDEPPRRQRHELNNNVYHGKMQRRQL
ncbi:hypothetical protein Y032_0334g2846 [Ancylostoma ceylanicum]|uniref:Uncharacterized protein n=1 Tax=Ancylostoma ceylanicum TaxID=53326 RepID=A0A016RZ06_9BILA|nr:hypothetical protein Y032_0334g2846 [Ancylostoma ceylanicum]